jgi:hypothetical protein
MVFISCKIEKNENLNECPNSLIENVTGSVRFGLFMNCSGKSKLRPRPLAPVKNRIQYFSVKMVKY